MEIKFEKFLLEKKLFNKIFKINPLKEIVLEFLEKENITTQDITNGVVDKYRIYDIYLDLKKELKKNGIDSQLREGTMFDYFSNESEKNHFWLECGIWVIDIFSLSNRGEYDGAIDIFYDNTNNNLYEQPNPIYVF